MLKINDILSFHNLIHNYVSNYKINTTIVTNGYMLSEENLSLLEKANVNYYQITLDDELHNQTRMLADGSQTHNLILKNIENLRKIGFTKCIIRVNISENASNNLSFYRTIMHSPGKWNGGSGLMARRSALVERLMYNVIIDQDFSCFYR